MTSWEGRLAVAGAICGGQGELGPRNLSKNVIKSGRFKLGNICMGEFMPLGKRRKYLGMAGLRNGPYACPMCEEMDECLHHFLGECKELRQIRPEIFGRQVRRKGWILEILIYKL